jgi:predicted dehydrogenase
MIGAGNYASAVLLPAFKAAGARLVSVASSGGVTGTHAAKKFGFAETTTDADSLFERNDVDAIVVATRHDSHARFVMRALSAGRPVFVEKPLCVTLDELAAIEGSHAESLARGGSPMVMVGFNRRFAPQTVKMKSLLAATPGPKALVMTVNAGNIPRDHWAQDRQQGGRVIGEACHFVDLLRFLADSPVASTAGTVMHAATKDTVSLTLTFADGSIGVIHYFTNGSKAFPKERLEVFAEGRILQLDNFRTLKGFGWPGFKRMSLWKQDKGQQACAAAFVNGIEARHAPIPFAELVEVARATLQLDSAAGFA